MRVMRAGAGFTMALVALGCGRATPPGILVGESEHFRLYVDPDATVPAGLEGANGLDALETAWSDVHAMLQMPDGKITYHLLSPEHVAPACEEADEGACIWESRLEIDSPTIPNAHELNHAYMYLRNQRKPVPFLAEGIAEAIACGPDLPMFITDVPWAGIVGQLESASDDVYVQGGIFVRYLIRTYGIDAFLRYYEQSPEQRDPALFAANFQAFWNVTMDDAWTAAHTLPPGMVSPGETKICPCALPALEPTGAVADDPARHPYWVLPDTAGRTLSITAPLRQRVVVRDCAGFRPQLAGQAVLARLDGAEPRYVLPPIERATLDSYLEEDCAAAAPYAESPLFTGAGGVIVAASTPVSAVTLHVNLASPFSGVLRGGLSQVCADCGFDPQACPPIAPGSRPSLQGPLYGRMRLHRIPMLPTDVAWDELDIDGP
jgi:hypothetical protein